MLLEGKSALITGSSSGLGFAMADALAQAGCRVVLHGLEPVSDGTRAAQTLTQRHCIDAHYVQTDLAAPDGADRLVEAAQAHIGSIDILINNAVIRHFSPMETLPLAQWQTALAVNLTAAFRAIQLTLPAMRTRGWGRIFNMTSVYGARGVANRVDYVTTKTALLGLTRAVAIENVGTGITCNAICPGSVSTPNIEGRISTLMQERGMDRENAVREFLQGKQPTGELVDAAHVGAMAVFLCSDAASQITGAMMPIEGGWLAA
jgi:3-hydroxybutyrate dehydrogenase